jgi:NAD(P) transhydrogenase
VGRSKFDVVVVGTTRAGAAAVDSAREQGLSVVVVDSFPHARIYEDHWSELSLQTSAVRSAQVHRDPAARVYRETIRQLWKDAASTHRRDRCDTSHRTDESDRGVTVFQGPARFVSPSCLELGCGSLVEGGAFVIATGSSSRHPERFDFGAEAICDVEKIVGFIESPRSVVIVGADWLGCEWAFVCASAGAEVTLIDRRSRLLRALDSELRFAVQSSLLEMGVEIALNEEIHDVETGQHGECRVHMSSGRVQVAERLLVLAGDRGNSGELGLAAIGVEMDSLGHIVVDDAFQSSVDGIFAIGAVSDPMRLGPSSTHQAHIALASVTANSFVKPPSIVPWILRSAVEVAMCGMTQESCSVLDLDTVAATAANSKCEGSSLRLAKVVVSPGNGRLLGVQMAGAGSSEAIALAAAFMESDCHVSHCSLIGGSEDSMAELLCRALRSAASNLRQTGRCSSRESPSSTPSEDRH